MPLALPVPNVASSCVVQTRASHSNSTRRLARPCQWRGDAQNREWASKSPPSTTVIPAQPRPSVWLAFRAGDRSLTKRQRRLEPDCSGRGHYSRPHRARLPPCRLAQISSVSLKMIRHSAYAWILETLAKFSMFQRDQAYRDRWTLGGSLESNAIVAVSKRSRSSERLIRFFFPIARRRALRS